MPVFTAHYGESQCKTFLYGEFLNLYGGGREGEQYFTHPGSLYRTNIKVWYGYGPYANMPEHLLRYEFGTRTQQ